MGEPSRSQTQNYYRVLGIPKSASLSDICRAYKSLVMKWHPDRNPSNKDEAEAKFRSINEAYRALSIKKREEAFASNGEQVTPKNKKSTNQEKDEDNGDDHADHREIKISIPTLLSRTTSRGSPIPSPTFPNSSSQRSTTPPRMDFHGTFPTTSSGANTPTPPSTPKDTASLSKAWRRSATPIFFSQSAARRKPHPIEKKLECSLEELCLGSVKKIKITRDAISSSGLIVQEEEILMIKVKPGWKKGTKITFEGKGDERPRTLPADIVFLIEEKRHPLFKREGDHLELGVEVPLVQALTGCIVPVPLLGGGEITLSIEDIIYPGYGKIIPGQGMPKPKEGKRGDLRLKFLVEFPADLSHDQRSDVVRILEERS